MIFEAKKQADLKKVSISEIVEHISLKDFLLEIPKNKKIVTCPVNALELETNLINSKCNDCGLCWMFDNNVIQKKDGSPEFLKFKKHVFKDKMFIYRWLSLSLQNYSGTEIISEGFSRNKRIPLVVKKDNKVYFVKAIRDVADVDKAELEMEDILDLSSEVIKDFDNKIIMIIIDRSQFKAKTKSSIVIYLEELYEKIISEGRQDIEALLK